MVCLSCLIGLPSPQRSSPAHLLPTFFEEEGGHGAFVHDAAPACSPRVEVAVLEHACAEERLEVCDFRFAELLTVTPQGCARDSLPHRSETAVRSDGVAPMSGLEERTLERDAEMCGNASHRGLALLDQVFVTDGLKPGLDFETIGESVVACPATREAPEQIGSSSCVFLGSDK